MQHDEVIWQTINQGFCTFRKKTITQNFCKNRFNISGLCNRSSCPLANSRYATILEEKGQCYLFMKTIERAHTPKDLWEKVKLSKNYLKAIGQLDEHLQYWPTYLIKKSKQRLTKIHQFIIRTRRLKSKVQPEVVERIRSRDKLEEKREKKAHAAAHIQDSIKHELLNRLREGVYGELYDDIVNYPQREYNDALDEIDEHGELDDELSDEFVEAYDDEEAEYEYEVENEAPSKRMRVTESSLVSKQNIDVSDDDLEDFNISDDDDDEPSAPPAVSFAERARARKTPSKPSKSSKPSKRGSIELEDD